MIESVRVIDSRAFYFQFFIRCTGKGLFELY